MLLLFIPIPRAPLVWPALVAFFLAFLPRSYSGPLLVSRSYSEMLVLNATGLWNGSQKAPPLFLRLIS